MTSEHKWRIVWGSWLAVGVVAEIVALLVKDDRAPLSHHMRQHTHVLGKTQAGQVALLIGATWLHRHLYKPMIMEAQPDGGHDPRAVLRIDGISSSPELRTWLARAVREQGRRRNGTR